MAKLPEKFITYIDHNDEMSAIVKFMSVIKNRVDKSVFQLEPNGFPKLTSNLDSLIPLFKLEDDTIRIPNYIYLLKVNAQPETTKSPAAYADELCTKFSTSTCIGEVSPEANFAPHIFTFNPKFGSEEFEQKVVDKLHSANDIIKRAQINGEKFVTAEYHLQKCEERITSCEEKVMAWRDDFKLLQKLSSDIKGSLENLETKICDWDPNFKTEDVEDFFSEIGQELGYEDELIEGIEKVAKSAPTIEKREKLNTAFQLIEKFISLRRDFAKTKKTAVKLVKQEIVELQLLMVNCAKNNLVAAADLAWDCVQIMLGVLGELSGRSNSYPGGADLRTAHIFEFVFDDNARLFNPIKKDGSHSLEINEVLLMKT